VLQLECPQGEQAGASAGSRVVTIWDSRTDLIYIISPGAPGRYSFLVFAALEWPNKASSDDYRL
jgi:hypothetical protein